MAVMMTFVRPNAVGKLRVSTAAPQALGEGGQGRQQMLSRSDSCSSSRHKALRGIALRVTVGASDGIAHERAATS
jgi:hypothetical protein